MIVDGAGQAALDDREPGRARTLATATALEPAWRKTASTTVALGTSSPRIQKRMLMRSSCTLSTAVATSCR